LIVQGGERDVSTIKEIVAVRRLFPEQFDVSEDLWGNGKGNPTAQRGFTNADLERCYETPQVGSAPSNTRTIAVASHVMADPNRRNEHHCIPALNDALIGGSLIGETALNLNKTRRSLTAWGINGELPDLILGGRIGFKRKSSARFGSLSTSTGFHDYVKSR
jgi:hypothetical protein